jgi:teichuronic acid exporter
MGVVWSACERFGQQGCVFVVQIVLARILAPEQFGLIAMVMVFMTMSGILVDAGFSRALIQRKDVGDTELSTIFYFNVAISFLMVGVLCLLAPLIAGFYQLEELTLILRVLSFRLILGAFGTIQSAILSRAMLFKRVFLVTLPSLLIAGGLAIYLAMNGFGVWALVAQTLSQSLLVSLALWFQSDWRPKLIFDMTCLKEMFPYGSRLALSSFLDRGFQSMYTLVIAKAFSVTDLAYFQRARSLQKLPVQNIHGILGRVTFPLFSSIQDDPPRMKRGMCKALQITTLFVFPGMALLSAISEPLIITLITDKWLPAVPYLKWLCLSGALFPMHAMNINVLLALGRSDLMLRLEVIKKCLVVMNILITYRFGIQAMVYGIVVTSFIALWINTYYTKKFIDYSCLGQLKDVLPMICVAGVIFAVNSVLIALMALSAPVTLAVTLCIGGLILLIGVRFVGSSLKEEMSRVLARLPGGRVIERVFL